MSNPTTPFNWQMPTNTDLVTDLPADFEVFGQAVASSMADLLGGTSGQILSKATNADMDFTWINNDQGDITGVTAGTGISGGGTTGTVTITNSMATAIDAKGDLVVGTGADAFSRLAAGTNNYVLTADSAEATGLKWAAAPSGKILQVVQATTTTSTTISSTSLTDTTITASITPTSATSKILVMVDAQAYITRASTSSFTGWALIRGATNIYDRSNEGFMATTAVGASAVELVANSQMVYLDSPATTSATTYKAQAKIITGSITFQRNSVPSSITLMEIGA